jgi:hypothetical protein
MLWCGEVAVGAVAPAPGFCTTNGRPAKSRCAMATAAAVGQREMPLHHYLLSTF